MTPKQFSKIRKRLWRSQQEAADNLGIIQSTVSHYETGRSPVPEAIVKLLTCLEAAAKTT